MANGDDVQLAVIEKTAGKTSTTAIVRSRMGRNAAIGELAKSFPYAPDLINNVYDLQDNGVGACDPTFSNLDSRLVPWRFATLFLRAKRVAGGGGSPNLYRVAASQAFTLFANGEGDSASGSGIGGSLTVADTNAQNGGGLVQNDQLYVTVGMTVTVLQPFAVTADSQDVSTKTYLPQVDNKDLGYGRRLIRATFQELTAVITHGNGACDYKTGPLDSWGSTGISAEVSNTDPSPGDFWYLSTPDVSTGSAQSNAMIVNVNMNHTVDVVEDGLNTIPTGYDVLIPYRISLIGFPACAPVREAKIGAKSLLQAALEADPAERAALRKLLIDG